eukprot:PhF_6_TR15484/c0_g1_i1/m.24084
MGNCGSKSEPRTAQKNQKPAAPQPQGVPPLTNMNRKSVDGASAVNPPSPLPRSPTYTPRGEHATKLVSYIEQHPTDVAGYVKLAEYLTKTEAVSFSDGLKSSSLQVMLRAIKNNPNSGQAYYHLGVLMGPNEKVTLPNGVVVDERGAYLESLQRDPKLADAFYRLAAMMSSGETITINERKYTEAELYMHVIGLDPTKAEAYFNLESLSDENTQSFTLEDGRVLDGKSLLVEAIHHKPTYSEAYSNLACLLKEGEEISLKNGDKMKQKDLLIRAIDVASPTMFNDAAYSLVMMGLGSCMRPDEIVHVRSDDMTQQDIWKAAIHLDKTCAMAYVKLASTIGPGEIMKLRDGRMLSKRELLLSAIQADPSCSAAYHALGTELEDGETIMLPTDQMEYTKEQLKSLSDSFAREMGASVSF